MDCREVTARYAEYEQGILSESEEDGLKAHLQDCPDCKTHAESMDRLTELLDNLPSAHPPRDMWKPIAERTEGRARQRSFIGKGKSPAGRIVRKTLTRPAFSICMALVVLAFGTYFGYVNYLDYQYPVMVEMPQQNPGSFLAVHAGLSAQDPLAQKGAWALRVALASRNPEPGAVPAPSGRGASR